MAGDTVTMSREDFDFIYDILRPYNMPFTHEDVVDQIKDITTAWKIVQRIDAET